MRSSRVIALALVVLPPLIAAAQDRIELNTISRIEVKGGTVEIHGSRKPNFTTMMMSDPARLVVDFSEAVFAGVPADTPVHNGVITAIKTASYGSEVAAIARVVIGYEKEVETDIVTVGGTRVVVKVAGGAPVVVAADVKAAEEKERQAREQAERERKLAEAKAAEEKAAAAERERAREQAERERKLAEAKAAEEKAAAAEKERLAREQADRERKLAEAKAAEEQAERERKLAVAKAAEEKAAAAEKERLAREQAERERKLAEAAAEKERLAQEQAERERKLAEARAEKERLAKEKAEREAAERAERERRLAEAKAAKERAAEEKAERVRQAVAKAEEERLAAQRRRSEETRAATSGRRKQVLFVGFKQDGDFSRVFVRTSEPVRYSVTEADGAVVLELEDTRIDSKNRRALDTSFFDSAVARVHPEEAAHATRVQIKLKAAVPYQAKQEGNEVYLDFERPGRR